MPRKTDPPSSDATGRKSEYHQRKVVGGAEAERNFDH